MKCFLEFRKLNHRIKRSRWTSCDHCTLKCGTKPQKQEHNVIDIWESNCADTCSSNFSENQNHDYICARRAFCHWAIRRTIHLYPVILHDSSCPSAISICKQMAKFTYRYSAVWTESLNSIKVFLNLTCVSRFKATIKVFALSFLLERPIVY